MNKRDQYELLWWREIFLPKLDTMQQGSDYFPTPGDKILGRRFRLVEIKPED